MFDLKSPCADCPFRIGYGERFRLGEMRLREIMTAEAFQCHKTVDYSVTDDNGFEKPHAGDNPQQCAGLMAVLHRIDRPNTIMQIASRLGHLDLDAIDPRKEAYAGFLDALDAHMGWGTNKPKNET